MAMYPFTSGLFSRRFSHVLPAVVLLGLLIFCAGCGGGSSSADGEQQSGQVQKSPQKGHGQGPHGPGGQGAGSEELAVPVAVDQAWIGPIASYYNSTATLESEREAQVLARVSGLIRELAAEEGDEIEAEARLLTIANDEYRLRVRQAEARTANLRSRFERLEAMLGEMLTTEEEFQAAKSDLASAEADEGLARLQLSYATVRAPFSGLVTQRLVEAGQNVSVGDPLFMLADFHPLLARVHVPSRELHQLQLNQNVDLILDSDGSRLQGTIKLISPVIDASSGTIKITVEVVEYPAGTRPGDFAEVHIVTELRPEAVLVPRSAVLTDKGESVVFVALVGKEGQQGQKEKKAKETPNKVSAERRVVEVGFSDDEHTQILSGLEAGEQVVVKGQRSLKHGASLKVLETNSSGSPKPSGAES
ncbi:MAG: efflux RND transporter periplasmic adaptor subunit [Gemmatimonadales bacterium]|nr:efflux RND transporter periplasmic adaptor subunit [Gemmatimonadales bacterium]